jgi:N-acetylmuramoyl-L-alanine amidase
MKACLILDPAHGIDTQGKRSPDSKFLEWMGSRMWINMLLKYLTDVPFDVKYPFYIPITEYNLLHARHVYNEPGIMKRRDKYTEMSKEYDKTLVLSFHANAQSNQMKWGQASGFELWTSLGWTEADELSNLIIGNFTDLFTKIRSNGPGDASKDANFTVISGGGYVGILFEAGFMDSKIDCANLLDQEWNKKLVSAYATSIFQIMNKWGVLATIPEVKIIN